jgi:hypothetical protein
VSYQQQLVNAQPCFEILLNTIGVITKSFYVFVKRCWEFVNFPNDSQIPLTHEKWQIM